MFRKHLYRLKSNEGAALVVGMVLLVVLTLLGLGGVMTSSTDLKIGGNVRQQSVAFYQAEAGWQEGLRWGRNLRALNIAHPTNATEQTTGDLLAQDPTDATNFGYTAATALGNAGSYGYRVVSLDPTAPGGYPSISPKQEKTGFAGKKTTAYSGTTKVFNYYYRIDSNGSGAGLSRSNINVIATYRSDN